MPDNFNTYLKDHAGLTDAQVAGLTSRLSRRRVAKGQFLLKEGDVCQHSFFVEHGLLRAYTIDPSGKEHIIQFAPENWFITDRSSVYFGEPSQFFIDAIEDSTVVFLDAAFMDAAGEASEHFRHYNDRLLHNHIRNLQRRINALLGAPAEQRYLEFVQLYPDIMLRVPQWMIASYLGITPESLSRVRKELASRHSAH
jgi:CRP-like cAMP-binding protein